MTVRTIPAPDARLNGKVRITQLEALGAERWADPDWSIVEDRRGELPEFPLKALPDACREWVEQAAHGANVTIGHVAIPMLGILSGLIGTARRVEASRSWSQPMTIWTAIVGASGTGKTPGIDVTKRALQQVERDGKSKLAELERAHAARVEAALALRKQWKKEVEEAVESGAPEPPMPVGAMDVADFIAPRLYVSNATIERIAVLLQARPSGMLMLSDELASLFLNMRRYSGGGQDNEFWLECWNGNPYAVERMGRSPLMVDHLLVGVVGGLQPDKLSMSFEGAADGMYARLLFSWPSEPGYRPLSNRVAEIEPEIYNAIRRIVDLSPDPDPQGIFVPRTIALSTEAVNAFEQFRHFVHREKEGFDGREREWWAKTPAHTLRLAGILAYLGWAWVGGSEPTAIDVEPMQSAIQLVRDYFWPHSRAALRLIGSTERHANSRRVLRWVRARKLREVSLKDVRRDALAQSLDAEQTQALLDNLVQSGWLREATTQTAGRARHRWLVNPQLLHGSAETAGSAESMGSTYQGHESDTLPALSALPAMGPGMR